MKSLLSRLASRRHELPRIHGVSDALLFIRIFLFAALVPVLMRLELPRLRALLAPKVACRPVPSEEVQQIADYVEAAIRVGRPFIRESCLTRGITRYYFLSRRGVDIALFFGMGQVEENLEGHCWLVKNGEPFLEKRDPREVFKMTYCFPAPTAAL